MTAGTPCPLMDSLKRSDEALSATLVTMISDTLDLFVGSCTLVSSIHERWAGSVTSPLMSPYFRKTGMESPCFLYRPDLSLGEILSQPFVRARGRPCRGA